MVKDLQGIKFGYLTADKIVGKNKHNTNLWECKCDCGNTKVASTNQLNTGNTKSCGCQKRKLGPRKDLSGDTYSNFTVLKYEYTNSKNSMAHYLCRCVCGTEKIISHGNLRSGHSTSCGCMRPTGKDVHSFKHGMTKTKVHRAWIKMQERCSDVNSPDYANYGAKGIFVSDYFKEEFLNFYSEIGDPPSPKHSVDRIDHTKGYESGNVRWATDNQQARNKGKRITNTSGETGVHFYEYAEQNNATYAVATWCCIETMKPRNKKFSVKKYGLLPAFKAAVEFRRNKIAELNTQGAGYTEKHGK